MHIIINVTLIKMQQLCSNIIDITILKDIKSYFLSFQARHFGILNLTELWEALGPLKLIKYFLAVVFYANLSLATFLATTWY